MPSEGTRFKPQPGPQTAFLATPADIAVLGGSAGGGKSWALCYDPLRHIKVKDFAGIVFRRSYPEITNAGGLWDQAGELYPLAGGRGVRGELEFRWKTGARVSFRHLEHPDSVHDYQGSQIPYLAFDEMTHFTESQFFYMLSRNRSKCGIRPYVRATTNPAPNWVKRFLSPWVNQEFDGKPAKSGELRWFTRVSGEIRWVPEGTKHAKSVTFIRASVYDNPALLNVNPEYIGNLMALPEVEQQRLLHGNWDVRHEGLVYPDFERHVVTAPSRLLVPPTDGGIDWGFRNPFAGVWGHHDGDDCLWVTGGRYRARTSLSDHSDALPEHVYFWCDPADPESIVELRRAGHHVRACVHRPTRGAGGDKRSPKMSGIAWVSERFATDRLKIVRCPETAALVRELGMYRYDPEKQSEEPIDADNHSPDALRYLVVGHDRGASKMTRRNVRPEEPDDDDLADDEAAALLAREKAIWGDFDD